MESSARWDVVIVGGRPAGASLAARLGARGARVLVLERAAMPSAPAVPSSPTLHPGALRLLDELGLDESRYAHAGARFTRFYFELGPWFETVLEVPSMGGRAHLYGVDRARFDDVLWRHLGGVPSVTRREGFSVRDVVRDGAGRVVGVIGATRGGAPERIDARCVVGADGRFSTLARRVGAEVVEVRDAHTSTVFFAEWEDVAPLPGGDGAQVCATGRGLDVLFFPMPGGRVSVNTHARSDRVHVDGDAEAYYRRALDAVPTARRRLEGARRVSPVVGMKRVANGYRRASGDGWVLVGDAMHFKDPVDGQGIYDALVGARALDRALGAWLDGGRAWPDAMRDYEAEVRAETHAMFLATCERLRRELYDEPPAIVARTAIRWMMTDPPYQERFLRFLGRELPAERWPGAAVIAGALARGALRDLSALVRGAPPARPPW